MEAAKNQKVVTWRHALSEKRGVVYVITNSVNGKRYIGITQKNPIKRWLEHKREADLGKSTYPLYKAMREEGFYSFTFHIVACAKNLHDLWKTEQWLIKQYNCFWTNKEGYNLTWGGAGTPGVDYVAGGYPKRGEHLKGRRLPEKHVERIRAGLKRNRQLRASEKEQECANKLLRNMRRNSAAAGFVT